MRSSMKLVSFKGVTISIHWSFLLVVAWILLVNLLSEADYEQLLLALLFCIVILLSLMLHELGHALVAGQFGIDAKKIILLPIGGIASIERLPENPKQELAISFAGPAMNLLIAAVLSVFLINAGPVDIYRSFNGVLSSENFLSIVYLVNLLLVVINLLPAFPLDGGRILRAALGFKNNYMKATLMAAEVGKLVAFILILAGIITLNPFPVLLGVYILVFGKMEEQYLRLKTMIKGVKLKEALMYDYNKLDAEMTVKEAIEVLMNNHARHFIVMDKASPAGIINRIEIIKAVAERNYEIPLRKLMKENLEYFDGEADASEVIDKLSGKEEHIFPVMVNGTFAGVVSFQHIIEYFLIHKADTGEYARLKALSALL